MTKSKPYTNRSNCVRAAKVALGKSAKPGVEFTLEQDGTAWTWTPTSASGLPTAEPAKHDVDAKPVAVKAKRPRAAKGSKSSVLDQPKMAKVVDLMQRQTGVEVGDGMERIGCNRDTFRGMVSRCKSAGVPVKVARTGRFVTYKVDPEWTR